MDSRSNFSDTFASGVEELFRRDADSENDRDGVEGSGGSGSGSGRNTASREHLTASAQINSQFGVSSAGGRQDSTTFSYNVASPSSGPFIASPASLMGKSSSHFGVSSPREPSRMFEKFIDVDVMKSMAELTCKPRHRVGMKQGFLQVIFFPLQGRFWRRVMSQRRFLLFCVLYFAQIAACILHNTHIKPTGYATSITASEVYFPPLLVMFMGIVIGRVPLATHKPDRNVESHSKRASADLNTKSTTEGVFETRSTATMSTAALGVASSGGSSSQLASDTSNGPRHKMRRAKTQKDTPATCVASPTESALSMESGCTGESEAEQMVERNNTSFMKQNSYTVRNEAEEQVDMESDTESSTSSASTSAAESSVSNEAPESPSRNAKKRNSKFFVNDPDEDPLSTIETINVLLWSQSAAIPFLASRSTSPSSKAKRTSYVNYASDADESGCERSPTRQARWERRADHGTDALSSAYFAEMAAQRSAKRPVPFKLPMTVIGIRRCILACVEKAASTQSPPRSLSYVASLAFALYPTLYRLLFSMVSLQRDKGPVFKDIVCSGVCSDLNEGIASAASGLCSMLETAWRDPMMCVESMRSVATPVNAVCCTVANLFLMVPGGGVGAARKCNPTTGNGTVGGGGVGCEAPGSDASFAGIILFVVVVTAVNVYMLMRIAMGQLREAEVTYGKRYLYAKYFSAITSLRRSQRYDLPHFRLKNVQNVMAWLSLRGSRAWLRHEQTEVAADSIVSISFQLFLFVVALVGMMVIQESGGRAKNAVKVENFSEVFHGQLFLLTLVVSYYLLHFMMTGTSINHKYGNSSLLLTEQLNIHLRIVVVSDRLESGDSRSKLKKEKLVLTSKVLDLAAKLLKELEGPNKISGLSMNPQLYNLTRVMVLSCLSAAISHILGFAPKLTKL